MLTGPIDVLTGDYLAELTTLILWKAKQKDNSSSHAPRSSGNWKTYYTTSARDNATPAEHAVT